MPQNPFDALLANYTALVARIDAHTGRVAAMYRDSMACRKGCDTCCRFLSLFPVEAFSLSLAFEGLSPADRATVEANRLSPAAPGAEDACPLLIDGLCMLYSARPIICRTHGFPIYMAQEADSLVDFCPRNFTGTTSFPKEALFSLDQLNATLTAVNAHFLSMLEGELPQRIPVDTALTLCRDLGLISD